MCRCGVSCDYIYKKLMCAESEGKRLSVDILFPEDELGSLEPPNEEVARLRTQDEL